MRLGEILQDRKEAILRRWIEEALAPYPERAGAFIRRQADPFANPVGHSVRQGTRALLDGLLGGDGAEKVREDLRGIVSIRAVQGLAPSVAIGFVLRLKAAIREEIDGAASDARLSCELAELEAKIDRMALAAFDVFVECRERISELRIGEVKREVAWVAERMSRGRAVVPGGGRP